MAFLIRFARRFLPSSETEDRRHGVSLQTRRLLWQLRHMLLALSVGVALFCTLQCVALATATRQAVVAARDLDAGLVIATGDVEMVEMPDHAPCAMHWGARTTQWGWSRRPASRRAIFY